MSSFAVETYFGPAAGRIMGTTMETIKDILLNRNPYIMVYDISPVLDIAVKRLKTVKSEEYGRKI